jgi:hypothetical protein
LEREDARRRTLYLSVVGALVLYLAYLAREAVVPLFVALLLAYVLAPLVAVVERRGFSRAGAVTLLFVLFFGSVGTAAVLAVPPLLEQGKALLVATVGEPARTIGMPAPARLRALLGRTPPATLEEFLRTREQMKPAEFTPEEADASGNWERRLRDAEMEKGEDGVHEMRRQFGSWLVGRHQERYVAWEDRNRNGKFDSGYLFDATLAASKYASERPGARAIANGIEDLGIELVPNLAQSALAHGGSSGRSSRSSRGSSSSRSTRSSSCSASRTSGTPSSATCPGPTATAW